MQPRRWKFRVQDILDRIAMIQRFTTGMTAGEFKADPRTVDAIIYSFIVIGEAASRVPDEIVSRYPTIPWSQMRGLRNLVVHEYSRVKAPVLWDTIRNDLPPLVPQLEALLENEQEP